eukprot:s5601_g1.t1
MPTPGEEDSLQHQGQLGPAAAAAMSVTATVPAGSYEGSGYRDHHHTMDMILRPHSMFERNAQLPHLEVSLPRAFENAVYGPPRQSKEGFAEYITRMDRNFTRLSKEGVDLPDSAQGYIIYRHAALNDAQDQRFLAWADGKYDRISVVKALRKLDKVIREHGPFHVERARRARRPRGGRRAQRAQTGLTGPLHGLNGPVGPDGPDGPDGTDGLNGTDRRPTASTGPMGPTRSSRIKDAPTV